MLAISGKVQANWSETTSIRSSPARVSRVNISRRMTLESSFPRVSTLEWDEKPILSHAVTSTVMRNRAHSMLYILE